MRKRRQKKMQLERIIGIALGSSGLDRSYEGNQGSRHCGITVVEECRVV